MKNETTWLIIAIIAVFVVGIFVQKSYDIFSITGSETIARTAPATTTGNFQITYTAGGVSGKWGASIVDSVSGGCKFPNGATTYNDVLLSTSGTTKTITITAPTTSATCTFAGDYQFGSFSIKSLTSQSTVVTICSPKTCSQLSKTCGNWDDTCGTTLNCGTCGTGKTCSSGTCINVCNTDADINCDGILSDDELLTQITKWINSQITRGQLGNYIMAWSG